MSDLVESANTERSREVGPFTPLLALQDADLSLDQLRHRRDHLDEQQQIDRLSGERTKLVAAAGEREKERLELLGRQGGFEEEIAATTARIVAIESQLASGVAASFRDQSAMASEIDSLAARRRQLEDDELEVMETLEPLESSHQELEDGLGGIDAEIAVLRGALEEARAVLDGRIATDEPARAALAADVLPELLGEYERIRSRLGGIGVARLEHGTCSGCHLALPATEVEAIKKASPSTLSHCEQCGRILVLG